ncbi:hypothetical protein ACHAXR_009395, partial [Thalassiosira sp. AJA248-18]
RLGISSVAGSGQAGRVGRYGLRNEARCLQAAQDIRKHNDVKGQVFPMTVELSSLKSVQSFANSYLDHIGNGSLDMLFMNAGIRPQTPMDANEYLLSEDSIELVFATNVVGHHLLYKRLERELAKSKMARVVLTSSCTSMINLFNYTMATDLDTLNNEAVTLQNGENLYGQSKLAQIMWAKKLTRRLGSKSHTFVNSVNPGLVATPIFSKGPLPSFLQTVIGWLQPTFWSADIAALSLLYLGVATEELEKKNIRGKYYHPIAVEVVNPFSFDEELQDKVWSFLDDLVKEFV